MAEPALDRLPSLSSNGSQAGSNPLAAAAAQVSLRALDPHVVLDARVAFVPLGEVALCAVGVGRGATMHLPGSACYRVVLPSEGQALARVTDRGWRSIDSAKGLCISPGDDLELTCRHRYSQVVVSFPKDLVRRELECLGGTPCGAPIEFESTVDLSAPVGRAWRDAIAAVEIGSYAAGMLGTVGAAPHRIEHWLLTLLVRDQPLRHPAGVRRRPGGVVGRVTDAIERRPEYRWTVDELAAIVPCGVRTLQASFRTSTGLSPTEYVRGVRLQRVHDELEESVAGLATVTEVAMSWGFSHMGRFSASYHKHFSEYPSETLKGSHEVP